jgi:hypothetical protein
MPSYDFTPVGFLVLQCFAYLAIISIFLFRIWVLQELAYKRSFQLTTLAHALFTILMLGTLIFCTSFSTTEIKVMRRLNDEQAIYNAIVTRSFSKVQNLKEAFAQPTTDLCVGTLYGRNPLYISTMGS